jgi:KDO2-lipid IV(A) lauroyltransferase
MKRIISFFVTIFFRILGAISCAISPALRQGLGKAVGILLLILSKKRRTVTYENIKKAFPENSIEERYAIVRSAYENLGITLVELLAFPTYSTLQLEQIISIKNSHFLTEQHQKGESMLLLSGHYGNWELLAFGVAAMLKIPFSIVVKQQQNSSADKILNEYRVLKNNSVIPMHSAARTIISKIKKGEAIAMLTDQAADPNKDTFVDFFGRPAVTYEAPAYLSIKYQIPIIFGVAKRLGNGKYEVELHKIMPTATEITADSVRELTQLHTSLLEEVIRQDPTQWSWQHKRWKFDPKNYPQNN